MHPKISVAVPTRHRPEIVTKFVATFDKNTDSRNYKRPYLTILYDAPERFSRNGYDYDCFVQELTLFDKSSLTELWNQAIILSPTDWVFICNDDIEFKPGWLEYLEQTIDLDQFDLVHLFHYGAMCFHKSLILKIGWFDERFRGGGYEDNDYQLRISEAGLKDKVDRSHDFIRKEGNREVGHFIDHTKYVHNGEGWQGNNNADWIRTKWSNANWSAPSYRAAPEVDWHPAMTRKYSDRFGLRPEFIVASEKSMEDRKAVFH